MHDVDITLQYKHCKTVEKMSAIFFRRREDVTKSGNSRSEADPIGKGLNIFILILHAFAYSHILALNSYVIILQRWAPRRENCCNGGTP